MESNMNSFLNSRETGLLDPIFLRRCLKNERASSIRLNENENIEQVFKSGVTSIDIESQDNRYMIAAGSESKIAIYDIANMKSNGEPLATIDRSQDFAHRYSIETVQWYPGDNGMFLTSSLDKSLKVWDSNSLQVAEEFTFQSRIYRHHMSAKHCIVAVGCDNSKIILCDLRSGSASHTVQGHSKPVLCLCWSPRCDYVLASGSQDNRVKIWDVRKMSGCLSSLDQYNGNEIGSSSDNTAHNGAVNGLSFTSDGLYLLSYGTDDCLRLWDVFSGKNSLINYGGFWNKKKKSIQIALSHDLSKDVVYVPSGTDVIVVEIFTGKRLRRLVGHYDIVNCCYYNDNYQELYSGGCDTHLLSWSPNFMASVKKVKDGYNLKHEIAIGAKRDAWSSDEDE